MNRNMKVSNAEIRKQVNAGIELDSSLYRNGFSTDDIREIEERRKKLIDGQAAFTAMQKLFDKYGVKISDGVANNVDEVIDKNILQIIQLLQNMVDYGDARIFKVLPPELDRLIKTYGVTVQNEYSSLITHGRGRPVVVAPAEYKQCRKCNSYKKPVLFPYVGTDMTDDGRCPICMDCLHELFRFYLKKYDDVREVLILVCHKIDVYIHEPILEKYVRLYETEKGKQDVVSNNFLNRFLADLNLQRNLDKSSEKFTFEHTRFDGVPFKCVQFNPMAPSVYNDRVEWEKAKEAAKEKESKLVESDDDDDSKLMTKKERQRLTYKFGKYSDEDLLWLENKYSEWEAEYDISELNIRKIIAQMCCQELSISQRRESGDDVNKEYKNFLESMKQIQLTPKQQMNDEDSGSIGSISELIFMCETRGPIVTKRKDLDDVDKKYEEHLLVAGALAHTLGVKNDLAAKYEKIIEPYTSSLLESEDSIGAAHDQEDEIDSALEDDEDAKAES